MRARVRVPPAAGRTARPRVYVSSRQEAKGGAAEPASGWAARGDGMAGAADWRGARALGLKLRGRTRGVTELGCSPEALARSEAGLTAFS